MKLTIDNELINKAITLYETSPERIDKQAKSLGIGRPRYLSIIKDNYETVELNSREDAWELFKQYPKELGFYRKIGKSDKTFRVFLLSIVMGNDELKSLVEDRGVSAKKIAEMINMPFITETFIHDRTNRLKFKYSKEAIKANRLEGLKETYSNPDALVAINKKRADTLEERYGERSPMRVPRFREKQEVTTTERWGVRVSTMNKEVQAKQQATSMKNNGVPFPAQNKNIYEKVKNTNIERYDVPYFILREDVRKKAEEAKFKKYGPGGPLSDKGVQRKIRATIKERYKVTYIGSSPVVREKIIATNMKRHGSVSPWGNKSVQEKGKITRLQRYGVENSYQIPGNREKMNEGRIKLLKFEPTSYVLTAKDSVKLLDDFSLLEEALREAFPDKEKFTIKEVADFTGRAYNTIKSKVGTAPSFMQKDRRGELPLTIHNFLLEIGYSEGKDFIINDRQAIKPLEIDFYFQKQKVGIEVNDLLTHNSSFTPYLGQTPKPKSYHMEKSLKAKEQGIRLIHAWEHYFNNPQQYEVLKNAIKHALGITSHRVYARNTYVKEVPNVTLKDFFNTNNIQGFRGAKTAYALFDKKTDEVLMAYSVGASHFAHNKYDMELIRGASKLDTTIVGGASKLWKFIINSNPEVNSIVYYIDRNIYNGSSISTLEGNLELISTQVGFWNYFVETGEMKNRQPAKHKEIKELVAQGKVWEVYNAGTETYVWTRN